MDERKIIEAFDSMSPDLLQKRRMLHGIRKQGRMKVQRPVKNSSVWVAVLALLLFSVSMNQWSMRDPDAHDGRERPMLTFQMGADGMGYAGIMLFSPDELMSANPWKPDWNLSTLPVFRHPFDREGLKEGFYSDAQRKERAMEIAERLGITLTEGEFPGMFTGEEGQTVHVNEDLSVSVQIPQSAHRIDAMDLVERRAQLMAVYEEYEALLDIEEPVMEIRWDYTFDGDKIFYDWVFSGAGNAADQLLNYSIGRIRVAAWEDQVLFHMPAPLPAERIEDYPLISWKTAQRMLLDGEAITSVPYEEQIAAGDIVHVGLVYYRNPYGGAEVQPLYEFYVELENDRQDNGLVMYGLYYVPAVHRDYVDVILEDMPFN